nr:hypothetical protein [Tanacetum cinerariifolium]
MVNTRTDADFSAAVQNALQTLLPYIRAEIRKEFRTSSGPSDASGNPPPVTIHTKQANGGDAWLVNMTWADFKKLFFLQFFPRAEQEHLKREYHSIRQTNTKTSTEFMQRFLRLAGFLGAVAGNEEEQAKNFQWGLRRSTLNHLMCMSYTDVAQKSGDRHQPTSKQSSHRNHGHNNDRHGSDRIPIMGVTRETGVSSPTDLPFLVLSSPGVPLRATPIQFALLVDADTQESVIKLLADKKPGASGRVFAITEGHAANTSGLYLLLLLHALLRHPHVPSIHDQPIVFEFSDVFPDELPGKPPVREVEFNIELIPGSEPIS